MNQELNALPADCDAPAYSVVHACRAAGFRSPEDVRWLRLPATRPIAGVISDVLRALHALSGLRQPARACACGATLPALVRYQFTAAQGKAHGYAFSQCKRCHTMYWDEFTV